MGSIVRIFSWNTAGRRAVINEQIEAVGEYGADVVCLQEVRPSTRDGLKDGLRTLGLVHCADSLPNHADYAALTGPRRTGELIASRWPLRRLNGPEIPWPEKAVSAIAEVPGAEIEVHAVHVPPGSSNGWIKIDTFNGIFRRLARVSPVARILCGDLNSPQCETADGQVVTWGQKLLDGCSVTRGKYKGRTGKEWDEGERSVLVGLADFDLYDVFRGLHGFGREDFSWHLRRKGETIRRRFDHLFASRRFGVRSCQYLHRCRESGLSDHSPIAARLEVPV